MRMSEEKRQRVYNAISRPIMDLRIDIARADSAGNPVSPVEVDGSLFALESRVWEQVKTALGLSESD